MIKRELPVFTARPHRAFSSGFYPCADFDYELRGMLGAAAYGAADVGEVLTTIDAVAGKDHWFRA
ncbi:hypothetical protein O1W68_03750 [Rhodococcus sp. H36-A4]|uniref:hypothetical protein n=1 Tax=Rhodococcus sp. H36-A4 TaxID=3004353 RepID=UPI0022AEA085|nr:hypothetical protein [Rhodococcus sp. H36-A4]MCZ4077048.1 hypothetical protein [Rhodococcus sp. H36-A4]